jgi:glycosyltransferase involved in cell wall biosynthesis
MVGVFEPYKGHTYLLEAIPLVKKKFSNIRFVLVGDGRTKKELEKLVQSRGLSEDVIFAGYYPQDQIIDAVGAFDIFVLPSLHEGLPYAILDAMSLGKPIVATKVGGIPEQINNGVSGILVPPRDSEELANAIIYLLTNEEKAKEMGLKARKKVRDNFTIKSMVSSMEELL